MIRNVEHACILHAKNFFAYKSMIYDERVRIYEQARVFHAAF